MHLVAHGAFRASTFAFYLLPFAWRSYSRQTVNYTTYEWLNIAIRWAHVFSGIMWIGQTYFFTWLDHAFHEAERDGKGQVWMVHSGGFYIVDRQKRPQILQQKLNWFRWETMFTWLTGLALFGLVYYKGGLLVDDSVHKMSNGTAILISIGLIIGGWIIYDLIWTSPIARNEMAGVVLCYLLLVATIYGLTHLFSGRGAYLQAGAMMGTMMTLNVWHRILPAQTQLIGAVKEGREPDMRLADIAKQRSKQNTFMVIPVVFIMLSNHFPVATYGSQWNWAVLAVLILIGWGVAKIIREH
jgi:uncharacterized membrane protein